MGNSTWLGVKKMMDDVGRTVGASPDLLGMVSPAYVVVNER